MNPITRIACVPLGFLICNIELQRKTADISLASSTNLRLEDSAEIRLNTI
jgi:hypothetical protein